MSVNDQHPDRVLIDAAKKDRKARKALIGRLRLLVLAPIRVCLRRWPARKIAGQDEDDLHSEVLFRLFANDAEALAQWDPTRGELGTYVSFFTRSRLKEIERKELRRLTLIPMPAPLSDVGDTGDVAATRPDELMIARQFAERVRGCLMNKLPGPKSQEMVELLYDQMLTTEEIVAETGMRPDQVSRWRYKIREKARECLTEIK